MTDIYSLLTQLNASLEGNGRSFFVMNDETEGFKKIICQWKYTLKEGNMSMFHSLREACIEMSCQVPFTMITDHLVNYKISWRVTFNMISGRRTTESRTLSQ